MAEILAPAGDESAFYTALHAGADAIYLGLRDFSARRSAANFSADSLAEHTSAAHLLGTKVYVALNTLVRDEETEQFFRTAVQAWNGGADALIVQDIFLGKRLKELYPQMVLHLSTQAGVCNVYGAQLAKEFGFSRVILARETPIGEIARIAEILETEVFVQGALCTCFSGQCYLSSLAGGNSGNRGLCKQPCRKKYSIDRVPFDELSYKLSLSDLSVGQNIFKLLDAGVASFKIEGRLRGADPASLRADLSDLKRTYNRGDYTRGLAFGQDKTLLSRDIQGHKGERVGVIVSVSKHEKTAYIKSAFKPSEGDGFKILRDKKEIGGAVFSGGRQTKDGFTLTLGVGWKIGDEVYVTTDSALARKILSRRRAIDIDVECTFAVGELPQVIVRGVFGSVCVVGESAVLQAQNAPLDEHAVADCFAKIDDYPFCVQSIRSSFEGKCFLVRSALNALRRSAYAAVVRAIVPVRAPLEFQWVGEGRMASADRQSDETAVICDDFSESWCRDLHIDYAVFKPANYADLRKIQGFIKNSEYYAWRKLLYLPAFMTSGDLEIVKEYVGLFDAVYAEGTYALIFCKECGVPVFAGTGFNLFNRISLAQAYEAGAEHAALSKELSLSQIAAIGDGTAFVLSGGRTKAMDLLYCPFGKSCATCDRRRAYTLKDEDGRVFPLLRYECGGCRFELYNSVSLVSDRKGARLYDLTAVQERDRAAFVVGEELRARLSSYTNGALRGGVR